MDREVAVPLDKPQQPSQPPRLVEASASLTANTTGSQKNGRVLGLSPVLSSSPAAMDLDQVQSTEEGEEVNTSAALPPPPLRPRAGVSSPLSVVSSVQDGVLSAPSDPLRSPLPRDGEKEEGESLPLAGEIEPILPSVPEPMAASTAMVDTDPARSIALFRSAPSAADNAQKVGAGDLHGSSLPSDAQARTRVTKDVGRAVGEAEGAKEDATASASGMSDVRPHEHGVSEPKNSETQASSEPELLPGTSRHGFPAEPEDPAALLSKPNAIVATAMQLQDETSATVGSVGDSSSASPEQKQNPSLVAADEMDVDVQVPAIGQREQRLEEKHAKRRVGDRDSGPSSPIKPLRVSHVGAIVKPPADAVSDAVEDRPDDTVHAGLPARHRPVEGSSDGNKANRINGGEPAPEETPGTCEPQKQHCSRRQDAGVGSEVTAGDAPSKQGENEVEPIAATIRPAATPPGFTIPVQLTAEPAAAGNATVENQSPMNHPAINELLADGHVSDPAPVDQPADLGTQRKDQHMPERRVSSCAVGQPTAFLDATFETKPSESAPMKTTRSASDDGSHGEGVRAVSKSVPATGAYGVADRDTCAVSRGTEDLESHCGDGGVPASPTTQVRSEAAKGRYSDIAGMSDGTVSMGATAEPLFQLHARGTSGSAPPTDAMRTVGLDGVGAMPAPASAMPTAMATTVTTSTANSGAATAAGAVATPSAVALPVSRIASSQAPSTWGGSSQSQRMESTNAFSLFSANGGVAHERGVALGTGVASETVLSEVGVGVGECTPDKTAWRPTPILLSGRAGQGGTAAVDRGGNRVSRSSGEQLAPMVSSPLVVRASPPQPALPRPRPGVLPTGFEGGFSTRPVPYGSPAASLPTAASSPRFGAVSPRRNEPRAVSCARLKNDVKIHAVVFLCFVCKKVSYCMVVN